ncbi:UPF0739 protein C1orf74 [Liparis tanakae]|uniref:UPF0739 protein C1orf74 n=1 Tax=Liparis tanakae TaxID=230148 RepID=A0A4Z2J2C3_9TELE|nr:UPF0739 protein C1orf74 [Liparis tanakae]
MSGPNGKAGPSTGVMEWIGTACRFATDRNDFRRNLLVNLGLFAAGVWVARNLSDFDLMSPQPSLDLASQITAVDLGLKPALLYDSNSAGADQVQQYLSSLQSSQLVSKSLLTLDLNGNALIVNTLTVRSNVEQLLRDNTVAVIDVCHTLEKPAIADLLGGETKSMTQDLLLLLTELEQLKEADKPYYVAEKSEEWNLCTVFGLLLGFPVTYWFDQTKSFENCLSMTPLILTTASATWQGDSAALTRGNSEVEDLLVLYEDITIRRHTAHLRSPVRV